MSFTEEPKSICYFFGKQSVWIWHHSLARILQGVILCSEDIYIYLYVSYFLFFIFLPVVKICKYMYFFLTFRNIGWTVFNFFDHLDPLSEKTWEHSQKFFTQNWVKLPSSSERKAFTQNHVSIARFQCFKSKEKKSHQPTII